LSVDELVDVGLGTNSSHDFDLNVDLDLVDVDDIAPRTIKLSDAKVMHHCCLVLIREPFIFWCQRNY
jgi:hypothetical protein